LPPLGLFASKDAKWLPRQPSNNGYFDIDMIFGPVDVATSFESSAEWQRSTSEGHYFPLQGSWSYPPRPGGMSVQEEETIRYINESEKDRGIPVIAVDTLQDRNNMEDLKTQIMQAGAFVNRRRKRRGINPRAVRVIVAGMPNVGKSSVINCLVGRKVAPDGGVPGVTKRFTWHKIGGFRNTEIEFLDSPGLTPRYFGKRFSEEQGQLMCMTKMFPHKIVDQEDTLQELMDLLGRVSKESPQHISKEVWRNTRLLYHVDFERAIRREAPWVPPNINLAKVEHYCLGVLADFNKGYWGKIQLEVPADMEQKRKEWLAMGNRSVKLEMSNSTALAKLSKQENQLALPEPKKYELLKPQVSVPTFTIARTKLVDVSPAGNGGKLEKVPVQVGMFREGGAFDGW